jgi:hypothetical protein
MKQKKKTRSQLQRQLSQVKLQLRQQHQQFARRAERQVVAVGAVVVRAVWTNLAAIKKESNVIKRIILDLIGGAFTVLGLLFAVVVLPEGSTQTTMATLFVLLTLGWLITGPLRWKE